MDGSSTSTGREHRRGRGPVCYIWPVRPLSLRSVRASLLLVLAVYAMLPRTLFHHHCERPGIHAEADAPATPGLHADAHCAICEAPAPVQEAASMVSFTVDEVELGTIASSPSVRTAEAVPEAPRPRGPPALA